MFSFSASLPRDSYPLTLRSSVEPLQAPVASGIQSTSITSSDLFTSYFEDPFKVPDADSLVDRTVISVTSQRISVDEMDADNLLEFRKENWYKYAGMGLIGMLGVAAFIAGLVFGYSWIGIAAAGIIVLASAYGLKHVDDQIKDEFVDSKIPKQLPVQSREEERKPTELDRVFKNDPYSEMRKTRFVHPLIGGIPRKNN